MKNKMIMMMKKMNIQKIMFIIFSRFILIRMKLIKKKIIIFYIFFRLIFLSEQWRRIKKMNSCGKF